MSLRERLVPMDAEHGAVTVMTPHRSSRGYVVLKQQVHQTLLDRVDLGRIQRLDSAQIMGELRSLAQSVFNRTSRRAFDDPEKVRRLRAVVARAREEIDAILADRPARTSSEL